ncbi:MAG: DUF1428 domain-containing protein [Planctomycetaceae bacterium]
MRYVDGYVLPVPKKNVKAFLRMAKLAAIVWRDHGALDYKECVAEDLDTKFGTTFPATLKLKKGETVVFAYIVFKSRADRDRINAKVMEDPRLAMPETKKKKPQMPFDVKRMVYGGFEALVDL